MKTKQYKINYTGVLYLYMSEIFFNAVIVICSYSIYYLNIYIY